MKGELTGLAVNSAWDMRKRGVRKGCKAWDDSLTAMGKVERTADWWGREGKAIRVWLWIIKNEL